MTNNSDNNRIIQKKPLKSQVSAYIRNQILTGELKPGKHIITSKIAETLDVGRGAIREALFELENEGLVINYPYRGSFVKTVSNDELEEICTIRALLETYAIKEVGTITDEDYEYLYDLCDDMDIAIKKGNYYDFIEYDSNFHGYFVSKANKSVLFSAWDTCSAKISLLLFSLISKNYPVSISADRHRHLLDVLRTDPTQYVEEIKEHYMIIPHYAR